MLVAVLYKRVKMGRRGGVIKHAIEFSEANVFVTENHTDSTRDFGVVNWKFMNKEENSLLISLTPPPPPVTEEPTQPFLHL